MWAKGEGEWNGMISRRNGEASTVVGAFGGWTLLGESEELRNFVFSCDTRWVLPYACLLHQIWIIFLGPVMLCCCG